MNRARRVRLAGEGSSGDESEIEDASSSEEWVSDGDGENEGGGARRAAYKAGKPRKPPLGELTWTIIS